MVTAFLVAASIAGLSLSPPVAAQSLDEAGWELVFAERGIEVHRRLVSDVVETLTAATVAAPPAEVFSVITDYAHYPEFMPHLIESQVIAQEGNTQHILQCVRISELFRFLLKDRCHVVRNALLYPSEGNGHYRVEWSLDSAATHALDRDDALPTRLNTGYWDLQSIEGGSATQVHYYLQTDPGGSIPVYFANVGTTQSIPSVIDAVRNRVVAGSR